MRTSVRGLSWASRFGSLLLLAAPATAGAVIVVDAGGGGDFTEIQAAISAAQEGDTILVRDGSYESFAVANKALTIVSEGGPSDIAGSVRVYNLAAGKTVVIENFNVTAVAGVGGSRGIYLSNNLGRIRLEACEITGADGNLAISHRSGWDAARIETSADVSVARCTLRGGQSLAGFLGYAADDDPGYAGFGILATQSTVTAHGTTIIGGSGQDGQPGNVDGGNGNDACRLDQSTLLASNCTFTGGSGGDGNVFGPCAFYVGGSAGFALNLLTGGNLARIQGGSESGGTPGCDVGGLCTQYCYPQMPDRFGSTFVDLASPPRILWSPSPVRESTAPQMVFQGQAGDQVLLFISGMPQSVYRPAWEGQLLVRPRSPHLMMIVGTTGSNGALTAPLPLGDLGPGLESITLYLQPLFVDTQGNKRLGAPSTMVVLDSAF